MNNTMSRHMKTMKSDVRICYDYWFITLAMIFV